MSQPIQPTAPVNAIVSIQPLSLAVPNRDATATPNPLANLPVGSTLEGFVVNRDAQNNPILRTAVGDVLVHSDVFLKTGSTVLLRVDATQDSRARIVTVDGQDVETYARQNTQAPLTKDTIAQQPLQSGLVRPAPVPGGAPPSPFPLLEALVLTSTGSAPNPQRIPQRPTLQFSPNTPVQLTVLDVELPPLPVALSSVPEVKLPASLLPPALPSAAAPQPATPQTAPQLGTAPVTTPTPATIPATNPAPVSAPITQVTPIATPAPTPQAPFVTPSAPPLAPASVPPVATVPAVPTPMQPATPPQIVPSIAQAAPVPPVPNVPAAPVPSASQVQPQTASPVAPVPTATPAASPAPIPPSTPPAAAVPASLPEMTQEVRSPVPTTVPQAMTAYRGQAPVPATPTPPMPFANAPAPHYAPPDTLANGTPMPANAVIATVIGHEADGANILQTPFATIKLYTQQPMPTGTHLTVQVAQTTQASEPTTPNPLSSELQKITSWTQDWPTLGEVVSTLGDQPEVLNGMLDRMPGIGPKLTSNVLFFLSAIRRGSVEGWLDKRTLRALESDAPSLLARLKLDIANMQQLYTDSPLKDWAGAMIPMLFGQEIHQTRLYIRQDDAHGAEKASGGGQRFILEVKMSQLGEIQLDGFVRKADKPTKQFDLIIRTEQALPAEVSQGIRAVFATAMGSGKLEGQIGFQHGSQHFVRPLAEKKTPPEEGFQQPILA